MSSKRPLKELCVAYHSCIKKLVRVPRWAKNHDLCNEVGLLTCLMLIASRQLLFQKRLSSSENNIIRALVASDVGNSGITAKLHVQIRKDYGLMELDLTTVRKSDVHNIFAAHLGRFVQHRLLRETVQGHDPG